MFSQGAGGPSIGTLNPVFFHSPPELAKLLPTFQPETATAEQLGRGGKAMCYSKDFVQDMTVTGVPKTMEKEVCV